MLTKTIVFSLLALFTLQASASAVTTRVARSRLEILASRQTAPPCETDCSYFNTATRTCQTKECYCNAAVASSLQGCINCVATDSPSRTQAMDYRSKYQTACTGFLLPVATMPYSPSTMPYSTSTMPHSTSTTPYNTSTTSPSSKTSIRKIFVVTIGVMIGVALVLRPV